MYHCSPIDLIDVIPLHGSYIRFNLGIPLKCPLSRASFDVGFALFGWMFDVTIVEETLKKSLSIDKFTQGFSFQISTSIGAYRGFLPVGGKELSKRINRLKGRRETHKIEEPYFEEFTPGSSILSKIYDFIAVPEASP